LLAAGRTRAAESIVVVERSPPEHWSAHGAPDLRVLALSRASERILRAGAAWEQIAAGRLCPYECMRIWHAHEAPRGERELRFSAAATPEPNLGFIVENSLVQTALLDALAAMGVQVLAARVEQLEFEADAVRLATSAGELRARLVVGADGARSSLRALAGLEDHAADYGQTAIVANVQSERPHEYTAWQRFLGDGTLALLPLASGECSIVCSIVHERARALLELAPEAFSVELTQLSDGVLGALTLASERRSYPLRRLSASRYVLERCALIGDAAHVIHPLAGQGANLGLLDAAALAQCIEDAWREREDPGALRVLRGYERWRRAENELMSTAVDAFNRLLATGSDAFARAAQHGLAWVNRSETVKRIFMERALGLAGDLPRAARRAA
jgi:2-octaprenylphenol hydroxylase